ncbi:MAG: carbohydrate ABC transporter permease [Maledivibacter sp.]|jgi:raffinose/stachyose/melibiose transport system permease protein|nr:carbohydrate ABC transporter permease [Maledivibacter sp.]
MDTLKKICRYVVVTLIALISITPFYVLVLLATSPPSRSFMDETNFLPMIYFQNFAEAWKASKIGLAILNSLIITIGAVTIIVLLASSAGYAIARTKNKFNRIILNVLLLSMMIPGIINTVPLYTLMIKIGGIDSYWGMILVCATNSLPFSIFLYTSFIKTVSKEIEEAAIIDGCTQFSAFFRVVFPLLKPVTSAVVIINGLGVWNNYAQAVFFLQSQSKRTIPLAISMFFQQYGAKWNLMAASAVIGVAPAVIAFLIFQKYFIKGITAGSVKG